MNVLDNAAFCWWLAGFTDGEGCFAIYKYGHFQPFYSLTARSDGRTALEYAQHNLGGIGHIYDRGHYNNSHPFSQYMIRSSGEAGRVLIPLFDAYPLQIKQKQYLVWRAAVLEMLNGKDPKMIGQLADTLRGLKLYADRVA